MNLATFHVLETSFWFAELKHDGTPSQNLVEHDPGKLGAPTCINSSLLLATRTPPQRRERGTREDASKQQGQKARRSLDGITGEAAGGDGRRWFPVSLPGVPDTEWALAIHSCHAAVQFKKRNNRKKEVDVVRIWNPNITLLNESRLYGPTNSSPARFYLSGTCSSTWKD
jgi:hypothetical protein